MPFFRSPSLDLEIRYETYGGHGPPVILMHGLASAIELWRPQIVELEKHCRLYAFDYPGHGRSQDKVSAHSIRCYAEVLKEFMDHLGLKRAHVMGLSLGCSVALTFAIHYPGRAASLILQGPVGGLHPPWHPRSWLKMLAIFIYLFLMAIFRVLLGKNRLVYLINRFGPQTHDYYELLDEVERQSSSWPVIFMTIESAYPPYVGKLERISTPVLILRGEHDNFPCRYVSYIREHLAGPCQYVELPNAKHVAALEQPELYNRACLEFIAAQPDLEVVDVDVSGGVQGP